jgi:hypothetical protein
MHRPTTTTTTTRARALRVDEMPIERLRDRAADARRILRIARRNATGIGGSDAVDAALDRAERLLPGLMDRTRSVPLLAIRRLTPAARASLRLALASGAELPPGLDGFSTTEARDALERLEIQESLTAEVLRLLVALETGPSVLASAS